MSSRLRPLGTIDRGDIRDASALNAKFSAYLCRTAFLTAPGRYYNFNVNGTRLDAMVRAGVRLIIFLSSCAIYSEPHSMPISDPCP
jgi:UDP-glucose 4-epimerase